jgi:hypothetical protein
MPIDNLTIARASTGILNPNCSMLPHMRSTAESFFRGLRGYSTSRSIGQYSTLCTVGGEVITWYYRP